MCLSVKQPKQQVVEANDPRASAAANAEIAARRNAFGYDATLLGGLAQPAQPSLSRQVLMGQ